MINKLASDIASMAQLKLVMINQEMEKRAALAKEADLRETLRALGAQAGDGLRNFGAQASEALAPYIAKAREGLSAAGSKAKQGINTAVDKAKAMKQSIENVPVMQDRINNSLAQTDAGLGRLRDALSKGSVEDALAYLRATANKGGSGTKANDINEAMLNYANKQRSNNELSNLLKELQGSTSGINDNLLQLVSGLKNKGYALGAGGALAGGLGGLGVGALMRSGSSQPDSRNDKKNKNKK